MEPLEKVQRYLDLIEESYHYRDETLAALDQLITRRYGSRRHFFLEILPTRIISPVTWGRWVQGVDLPSKRHLEALLPHLRNCLGLTEGGGAKELVETLCLEEEGEQALVSLLTTAPHEDLTAITDAAILQANEAEFPSQPIPSAKRRRSAIRLLSQVAQLTEAGEPERYVLGGEAAVTLAMLLAEVGKQTEAREKSLEGAYCLDQASALAEPVGYPGWTYGELVVLGYTRAGIAASNSHRYGEAERYYRKAIGLSTICPYPRGQRLSAGIHRDWAIMLARQGRARVNDAQEHARISLSEFHKMQAPDDPILCYVSLETMARVAMVDGRDKEARKLVHEAKSLEASAHPGPIHQVLLLRREAEIYLRDRDTDGWLSTMERAVDIAESAGLEHQLLAVKEWLAHLGPGEQALARSLAERVRLVS